MTAPRVGLPRGPLGDVEERIRNELEQEGPQPLELDYGIVPVVLVGDGTLPGRSLYRTRSFSKYWEAVATGTNLVLGCAPGIEGFIVDQVNYSAAGGAGAAADAIRAYQYPPSIAPVVVPSTSDVFMTDRYVGDFAPIFSGSGAGAPTVNPFHYVQVGAGNWNLVVPVRWFIPQGTVLAFRPVASAAGQFQVNVMGRTF